MFSMSFTLIFGDEFHEKSCGHCWRFPEEADEALPSASRSPGGIHMLAGRVSSLDCEEFSSEENLSISDSVFP